MAEPWVSDAYASSGFAVYGRLWPGVEGGTGIEDIQSGDCPRPWVSPSRTLKCPPSSFLPFPESTIQRRHFGGQPGPGAAARGEDMSLSPACVFLKLALVLLEVVSWLLSVPPNTPAPILSLSVETIPPKLPNHYGAEGRQDSA